MVRNARVGPPATPDLVETLDKCAGQIRLNSTAMKRKIDAGIICRAHRAHAKFAQDSLRSKIGSREHQVGALPYRLRRRFVKSSVKIEIPFQLQVRPVIERVAERVRGRLC